MSVPQRTVVVVHGIGQQAVGATATAWIESFLRFCAEQGRRAEVVENRLDQPEGAAVLAVAAPGTEQDAVVDSPVLRLRVVEARWVEAFAAPSPAAVLRWLLWFGPCLAHAQVFLSWRARARLESATEAAIDDGGLSTGERVASRASGFAGVVAPVLYLLGGLVLLAVGGPLVLLLLLLALLGTLVPVDAVQKTAARLLTVVSAQVGDVSTFLGSPVARGAMEQVVDSRIRTEVARAGREGVHVLAHSQGAALTHAVLRRLPPELRPRGLTTVGGAHGRLHDMRLLTFPRWTAVPVAFTGMSWLLAFPVHGRLGWPGLLVAPGAVTLLTLLALLLVGRSTVRRLGGVPSPGRVPGVPWLDLWAPFDPVHTGRPVARSGPEYLGQTVPGRMTFLLDHVWYEKDWTETVPRVLAHVTAGLPVSARLGARRGVRARKALQDPEGQGPNWTPWSRRDWVFLGCRALTILLWLGLVVGAGRQVTALGSRLRGLGPLSGELAGRADALWTRWWSLLGGEPGDVAGGTDRVVGALVLLSAALLVARTLEGVYGAAVEAEARTWVRSLPGGRVRRWSTRRWTLLGAAVLVPWAVVLATGTALLLGLRAG